MSKRKNVKNGKNKPQNNTSKGKGFLKKVASAFIGSTEESRDLNTKEFDSKKDEIEISEDFVSKNEDFEGITTVDKENVKPLVEETQAPEPEPLTIPEPASEEKTPVVEDKKPTKESKVDKKTKSGSKTKDDVKSSKESGKEGEVIGNENLSQDEINQFAVLKQQLSELTPSEREFANLLAVYQLNESDYEVKKDGKVISFNIEIDKPAVVETSEEKPAEKLSSAMSALDPKVREKIMAFRAQNKSQIDGLKGKSQTIIGNSKSNTRRFHSEAIKNVTAMADFTASNLKGNGSLNADKQYESNTSIVAETGRNIMRSIENDDIFLREGKINITRFNLVVQQIGGMFLPEISTNDLGGEFKLRDNITGTVLRFPENASEYIPTM